MKTFSIIIPVYNGQNVIGIALDSIYSQGMADDSFEVICVDDCSPTMETSDVLNNYTYNGERPANLKVFRHEVNKRQGGARNTGLKYAEGEWILYLDSDDYFVKGSLLKLQKSLNKYAELDCVMFDHQEEVVKDGTLYVKDCIYAHQDLKSTLPPGTEFIQKYPVPWVPWLYAYKKCFLQKHNISFVEKVRYEDTDYVIRCTLLSNKIIFIPIDVVGHIVYKGSTSTIGTDKVKLVELFQLSRRLRIIAEDFMPKNMAAAKAVMGHHIYHYKSSLTSYLWRFSYRNILQTLINYPPYENSNDKLINFTRKHPRLYAALAQVARPFLLAAIWMKNKLK